MRDQIRKIQKSDIGDIAQIHMACFQETLLTKLGKNFLEKYYMYYIEDNPDTSYVYKDEHGKTTAFVIGIMNGNATRNRFFKKNLLMCMSSVFLVLIKYRLNFIKQAIPKIKGAFNPPKEDFRAQIGSKGGILSIAVLEGHRGKNVAGQLVAKFEEAYFAKGERVYNLGVKKDNIRAIKFYEKVGLKFGASESETIDIYYKRLDKKVRDNECC